MRIGDRFGIGRGHAPGGRGPWARLRRPAGIRNGGLLLVLVALAAVMALVDQPPQPGAGRRLPGIFQYLPPPVGITAIPPVVDQPLPAAEPAADAMGGESAGPSSVDRGHPRRTHPRPVAAGPRTSAGRGAGTPARPVRDQGGSGGGTRPPAGQPPVATPPVAAAPVARVRVPPVTARVKPPVVLGRELPEVRVRTPGAAVDVPAGLTALP
jgi:hypothetical protein